MSKKQKSQLEGALTGQIWDNLNIKDNNAFDQLQCIKCIKWHESIVMGLQSREEGRTYCYRGMLADKCGRNERIRKSPFFNPQ